MIAVLVHKYKNGDFIETYYFKSRRCAVKWLREEGCRVREELTCKLDGASVIFTNGMMLYEMEEDSIKNGETRQRNS